MEITLCNAAISRLSSPCLPASALNRLLCFLAGRFYGPLAIRLPASNWVPAQRARCGIGVELAVAGHESQRAPAANPTAAGAAAHASQQAHLLDLCARCRRLPACARWVPARAGWVPARAGWLPARGRVSSRARGLPAARSWLPVTGCRGLPAARRLSAGALRRCVSGSSSGGASCRLPAGISCLQTVPR